MLPRKGVRALLHRPTKLFLIPAISIWKTSLVSATLLCNKLLQNRFHLFLAFWEMFENVIPKTPQQKGPFDQRRTIKKSPEGRERRRGRTARAHVTGAEGSKQ